MKFDFLHLKEFDFLHLGTSLAFQWLRLYAPSAGGPGPIPSQGTRPHVLQLRPSIVK